MANLRLPFFPDALLNTDWIVGNRSDRKSLGIAVASIRCTLASMCVIHVHSKVQMRLQDVHQLCMNKYKELIKAFMELYENAAATEFLEKTTLSGARELTGKNIWKIGCDARKSFVNFYNPGWKVGLGPDGSPPSGKDYE